MLEKIVTSILAAFLPFIVTYLSNKNKASTRKRLIEEAQKKVEFLDKYYEVSKKLLNEPETSDLKNLLAGEILEVKNNLAAFERTDTKSDYQKLSTVQKIFLTFKPASIMGWVWTVLFFFNLTFLSFGILGFFVDAEGNFSSDAFAINSQDTDTLIGIGFFIFSLFIFRWLAIRNYRSNSSQGKPK